MLFYMRSDFLHAWIKASDKFLRVTYKEDAEKYFAVTAVEKKKGWR